MAVFRFAAVALALLSISSVAIAQESIVVDLLGSKYDAFVNLLEHANLLSTLEGIVEEQKGKDGGVSIFAPTDYHLMHKVSPALLSFLREDRNSELLRKVLLHHIVPGKVNEQHFDASSVLTSLSGHKVSLSKDATSPRIADVDVREMNVLSARDGVVHAISGLLIPDELLPVIKYFEAQQAEEEEVTRRAMRVAGSQSIKASSTASAPAPSAEVAAEDAVLVGVLSNANFSTLAALLTSTGLTPVIESLIATNTPFTLFAPSDTAFAALGTAGTTVANNNTLATTTLLFHVVQGHYTYDELLALAGGSSSKSIIRATSGTPSVPTYANESLTLTAVGSQLYLNTPPVAAPNTTYAAEPDYNILAVSSVLVPETVSAALSSNSTTPAPPPPKGAALHFADLRVTMAVMALVLSSMLLI